MKSFFKKLAFVMALAMVVSMAAPAGTAALAAELYIADEAGKKAETFKLEIGEKEDFSFKNAPKNWKDDYKWTSSDTSVATVDQTGLVTGKADGEATITVTVLGVSTTCKVTVGKGKVATNGAYTVKQTTATEIEVYFDGKTSYTKNDIKLEFVLDVEADYRVQWPIETVKEIENGFQIKPYVNFSNGDTYVLTIGAEDKGTTFQTIFGQPDRIELTYTTGEEEGIVYVSTDDELMPAMLNVKFFSGDVDVTSISSELAPAVEYEFVLNTDEDSVGINADENDNPYLYMTTTGAGAILRATFNGSDENGELYTLVDETDVITAVKAPEYVIKGVVNWAIVDATYEDVDDLDWSKPNQDISAFDDESLQDCKIVVLIVDSENNYYVSDARFTNPEAKIYGPAVQEGMEINPEHVGKFAEKGYSVQFESSDTSKLLVGRDGSLTTYTEAKVPVIVSLHNENIEDENNPEQFVKYVGAPSVVVTKKRTLKSIVADAKEYKVLSHANDGVYTKTEITLALKDQYGELWGKDEDVVITATYTINGKKTSIDINATNKVTYDKEEGEAVITVDGADIGEQLDVSLKTTMATKTIALTFKVGDVTNTTSKITLVTPSAAGGVINTPTKQLTVESIDQKVAKDEKIPAKTTIKLNEFNNKYAVGHKTDVYLYDKAVDTANGYTSANVTEGALFLQVLDPDENKVSVGGENKCGVYGSDGVFYFTVASVTDDKIDYAATGTYTAKLVKAKVDTETGKVTFVDITTKGYKTTFAVTNTSSLVEFVKVKTGKTATEATTIEDIVYDTLEFNLNGSKWNFTVADIADVDYKYNGDAGTAGYVIITKVTFKVPVDGGYNGDTTIDEDSGEEVPAGQQYFYECPVTVNKAIELLEGLPAEEN